MKKYSIVTIITLLIVMGGELSAFRGQRRVTRPQTTAEQLMTKYTPKPYPLALTPQPRRFDRAHHFGYAPYSTYGVAYDDYYSPPIATNEPEHLGID